MNTVEQVVIALKLKLLFSVVYKDYFKHNMKNIHILSEIAYLYDIIPNVSSNVKMQEIRHFIQGNSAFYFVTCR